MKRQPLTFLILGLIHNHIEYWYDDLLTDEDTSDLLFDVQDRFKTRTIYGREVTPDTSIYNVLTDSEEYK